MQRTSTAAFIAAPAAIRSPAATASPSSLQLALENKELQQRLDAYITALSKIVDDQAETRDAVGMAFAINGKMNSAEIYSDPSLFKRMWPKLLKSAATEAFAEMSKDAATPTTQPLSALGGR